MNKKNWVPGFIWLTPRGREQHKVVDGKNVWYYTPRPPMLVAVGHIAGVTLHRTSFDGNDIARASVTVGSVSEECYEVTETVEEIAELIRLEWESRVNRDAEIRWASTTGERR